MRHRLVVFAMAAVASVLSAAPMAHAVPIEGEEKEVQLFILAGQSNMEGLGLNAELPKPFDKPQADVQIWFDNAKGFQPLAGGFGHVPEWFGPEVTLGRMLKDARPNEEIVLVKAAYSGANLAADWNPKTGKWYGTLKEKVKLARAALEAKGKRVRVAGFFWIQGESDAMKKEQADGYAASLESFIATARKDYGSPGLPFVFTRVHEKLGAPDAHVYGNHGFDFVPSVRKAQQAVAEKVRATALVDTDDLPLRRKPPNYDNLVHYDSAGFLKLGSRMAKAYLDLPKEDGRQAAKALP